MLRSLSKFVLEVLPSACATVIAGVLLSAWHGHFVTRQDIVDPRPLAESAGQQAAEDPARRVEADHGLVAEPARQEETVRKTTDASSAVKAPPSASRRIQARHGQPVRVATAHPPQPDRGHRTDGGAPSADSAVSLPMPPPPAIGADATASAAADRKADEPKRVFGVTVPSVVVAIGDKLDPMPAVHAGERVVSTVVVTAKSWVPDFGH